ncbi:prepilin-type N-terminal cleavage/methylation domain-containing protein [bacterium]|nr:prepilin-type N-terminal cleavage/methylation domain-containing protein [bacterium]
MSKSARRAVTFIEVMFVVVIIGIVLAVAVPNMAGSRDSAALKGTVRDLVSGGLLARQMAVTTGEQTFLVFRPKDRTWRMEFFDASKEEDRRWQDRRERTSDERDRPLERKVEFSKFQNDAGALEVREEIKLAFYPNGTCSGMAVQVKSDRGAGIVVDFDRATGRPEVYNGEPKSLATKLKEQGIDPTEFGLIDDTALVDAGSKAGEGFKKIAGWTEEERVGAYKDAVDKMLSRSRKQYDIQQAGGAAAFYAEAQKWGK